MAGNLPEPEQMLVNIQFITNHHRLHLGCYLRSSQSSRFPSCWTLNCDAEFDAPHVSSPLLCRLIGAVMK